MSEDTLTITDNRTGKQYELPIQDGTIKAMDLRQIKTSDDDFGLMTYDPAFMNTASCKSRITFIDGDKGILEYRGYPIDQLAEKSTYLEVAYLLLYGELPNASQLADWTRNITYHTFINENIKKVIDGFHYNAHPMGMFEATLGALSTFYPDAKDIFNVDLRWKQIYRLIAKVPTIAAFAFRHRIGMQYSYPDNDLSYEGNFLNMMFKTTELKYKPNPVLERALTVLYILHADHEQNCSTNAMRSIGSAHTDPFSSLAGAAAALYGPLHGGANEMVLRMLKEIGSVAKVPDYIKRVKAGEFRLMGFGHRVYKNYDPRARIIKQVAYEVFEVTGKDPLLDRHVISRPVAQVDLTRARDLLIWIFEQFHPLRQPSRRPRNRKHHRKHVHRKTHRLVDDPRVKVDVWIQAPLHEVFVFKRDPFELESDVE